MLLILNWRKRFERFKTIEQTQMYLGFVIFFSIPQSPFKAEIFRQIKREGRKMEYIWQTGWYCKNYGLILKYSFLQRRK